MTQGQEAERLQPERNQEKVGKFRRSSDKWRGQTDPEPSGPLPTPQEFIERLLEITRDERTVGE